jgi:hypothetical protein
VYVRSVCLSVCLLPTSSIRYNLFSQGLDLGASHFQNKTYPPVFIYLSIIRLPDFCSGSDVVILQVEPKARIIQK